jgi:hypothetical protein
MRSRSGNLSGSILIRPTQKVCSKHNNKTEKEKNMHDRRLAVRAGELKPSAVRELFKHSKLPGVISLGGGIPRRSFLIPKGWSWRCRR